ncbi:MAG: sensor histidine kinase [Spirosomataceae bacterium]
MRIILLLLVSCTMAWAQNPRIDSLRKTLNGQQPSAQKINTLYELGLSYWVAGEEDAAMKTYKQALAMAQQLKLLREEGRVRLFIARMEGDRMVHYDSAYTQLDRVEKIAKAINDKSLEALAYQRRASIYENIYEHHNEVMPLLTKAMKLLTEAKDSLGMTSVWNLYGNIAADEGKYSETIDWLLKCRKIQEAHNDWFGLRASISNLGYLYKELHQDDLALKYLQEGLAHVTRYYDDRAKAMILYNMSSLEQSHGRLKEALEHAKEAAKVYEKPGYETMLSRYYGKIGEVYLAMKDYKNALYYTTQCDKLYREHVDSKEALTHVAQINFGKIYLATHQYQRVIESAQKGLLWATTSTPPLIKERSEYYRQLAEAYEKTGQNTKALQYLKLYKVDSDSLLSADRVERASIASMNYEYEKKQQKQRLHIQALENKNLSQLAEKQQLVQYFLVFVLLASIGVAVYGWKTNRKLKEQNEALLAKNREIEEALLKGQTLERKRVASELHDNVATKLSALRWRLETIQTKDLTEKDQRLFGDVLTMAEEAYGDIRLISHNLLPVELETQGLAAAIQKLTSKLNESGKIQFVFTPDGKTVALDRQKSYDIYTITLELLNNVLKHAKATEVNIVLTSQRNQVHLEVSDNGVGIAEAEKIDVGMGLRNIQNRLDTLKGKWNVVSELGKGTRVEVMVPV